MVLYRNLLPAPPMPQQPQQPRDNRMSVDIDSISCTVKVSIILNGSLVAEVTKDLQNQKNFK